MAIEPQAQTEGEPGQRAIQVDRSPKGGLRLRPFAVERVEMPDGGVRFGEQRIQLD